jgi:phenylalanyl-tRNA synthetase beta chain
LKISLNWLKEYIDLNGISSKEIADKLTMSGLEVEDIVDQTVIYENFVIGEVTEKQKHPNADKLSLCKVSTGEEEFQVVCGAPNVAAGQKVILAKPGAVVPKGGFKIGKAKIRGVESSGMICSEAELELGQGHEGIMVLNGDKRAGERITDSMGLNDVIFEIGITPNRPDALSHIGVARDLAAIFNRELMLPVIKVEKSNEAAGKYASIKIEDKVNCPRYSAKLVRGVKVSESPEWLKRRLVNIGLRPRNNIVDVTNYVMYETGQPLHAFDLDLIAGGEIIVRSNEEKKKFITLDSKERELPAGALMICDKEREIAIAGVMGGENSEITDKSSNVLIESAYFNPSSVRRTAKGLGLSSDASYRFERGTNPDMTVYAAERAAELIRETGGGEILDGVIDAYPEEIKKKKIELRVQRVKKILGYEIEKENIENILRNLGFEVTGKGEVIEVEVPNFRPDIEREIDLIEEAARIYGYDNIPTVAKISTSLGRKYDESDFAEKLKSSAVALGFREMINNPMQGGKSASVTGSKIRILNPLSEDMAYLRTSLIPGGLESVSRNIKVGERNLLLFEAGNVFNKRNEEIKSFDDFSEEQKIVLIVSGLQEEKSWNQGAREADFYALKGLTEAFLSIISLDYLLNDSYSYEADTIFEYKQIKEFEGKKIGEGGKVKKDVLSQFDIEQDVYCYEFDVKEMSRITGKKKLFRELLRYPKVERDFAFIFDKEVRNEEVIAQMKKAGGELLKSVRLFDLFEHESLGEGKKSMAYTLEFFDEKRTLMEEEVDKEFNKLISEIEKKFNAKLRG